MLVAYPPGLEMICAFFACAHAGLIPVPVASPTRPSLQASLYRMAHIARDCQPVAVLTTTEVVDLVGGYWAAPDASAVAGGQLITLPWIATPVGKAFFGRIGRDRNSIRSHEAVHHNYRVDK
jgi:acyl-CoA synthetase (AMP-forming)/AMP-acid ligase II